MASTAQQTNVERARIAYEAFGKGDMAAVSESMTDDTVWHIPGNSPLAGDYKGKDAVFGLFGKLMELTGGTLRLEVHDILANEEHGAVLVTEHGQRNGKILKSRAVHVSHLDSQGRVKEFWSFNEDQAALDAFYS